MLAHALQAAAGAHETMSNHHLLRSCMLTLAHVQRHVLQTAAGANETLLSNSLFRSRMHLTSVRVIETKNYSRTFRSHRRLSAARGVNSSLFRSRICPLAHVQRHVLQTASGVNETLLNYSSDRPLHSLFRSRMSTLAHVQRHAPQTAAGAHEAMLSHSSLPAFSYASVVIDGRCQASDAPE